MCVPLVDCTMCTRGCDLVDQTTELWHDGGLQVGIVSYGVGCGRPATPGVYTKVSEYRGFIAQQLQEREHAVYLPLSRVVLSDLLAFQATHDAGWVHNPLPAVNDAHIHTHCLWPHTPCRRAVCGMRPSQTGTLSRHVTQRPSRLPHLQLEPPAALRHRRPTRRRAPPLHHRHAHARLTA